MKHLTLAACAATLSLSAVPASAMMECQPGKLDPRVCFVDYNPNDVLHINAALHSMTLFEFAPDETNPRMAATAHDLLLGLPEGNTFALKPKPAPPGTAWDLQGIILYTTRPDGSVRNYVIQYDLHEKVPITSSAGVTFKVIFRYPGDVQAKQAAAWRAQQAQRQVDEAKQRLSVTGPGPGSGYPGYVCDYVEQHDPKNDLPFIPTRVCDDNQATFFTFPGNMSVPTITVDGPDGKAMVPMQNYDRTGSYIAVHGVYKHYYLRIGDALDCIWKTGRIDQVGYNNGNGTSSRDVERVLKPLPAEEPQ